jgi:hypothetical protein
MGKWHNLGNTRLYSIWKSMRTRCNNPNSRNYKYYGGKGVRVCSEWNSFRAFYDWAMAHGYSDELTLDRKNFDGNYEPSNCRWVPLSEQQRNRSDNCLITMNGETKCLCEWARHFDISYATARSRHEAGKSWEEAFTLPIGGSL